MSNDPIIRLALQKTGRLADESFLLLEKAGIRVQHSGRTLKVRAKNFPLEILLLRTGDIPEVLRDGAADVGIIGENILYESEEDGITVSRKLGFGECRLSLAVPEHSGITSIEGLGGKLIATSHGQILQNYLTEQRILAKVVPMSGSVEIAPALNMADAICDLVSSGTTLAANSLKELATVMRSEAVLAVSGQYARRQSAEFTELLMRIDSVIAAYDLKSVIMNVPVEKLAAVSSILPGLESPTVMPLAREGWVAVHSVAKEDSEFWRNIASLKQAGATGILVMPVERVIY